MTEKKENPRKKFPFSLVQFAFASFFFSVIVVAQAIVGCLNLLALPLPRRCHGCAVLCLVVIYLLQFTGGCRIFTLQIIVRPNDGFTWPHFFRVYCGNCSGNIFIFLRNIIHHFGKGRNSERKEKLRCDAG